MKLKSDMYYYGQQAMLWHGTSASPISKEVVERINELEAEIDGYQQMQDEIIVALGAFGLLPSDIVPTINLLSNLIVELESLADARLKDRLIMQESNVTAHKRNAKLEAKIKNLREEYTERQEWGAEQAMTVIKNKNERIAKLEAIIKTLYIETSDNGVQQHIKIIFRSLPTG